MVDSAKTRKYQLATWVTGYCLFFTLMYISRGWAGDHYRGNGIMSLWLLLVTSFLSDFANVGEHLYVRFFPTYVVGKKKVEGMATLNIPEVVFYQIKTRLFVYGSVALMAYLGVVEFPEYPSDPISLFKFLLFCQFESLITGWLRDGIGMEFGHRWMHKPEHYQWHKVHHKSGPEVNAYQGAVFDYTDLFLENGIGLLSCALLKYFIFGRGMFVQSVLFELWHDIGVHSVNPYFPCFLNPIGDLFIRSSVAHSLHHALLNSRYHAFPFHQLFGNGYTRDVDDYNKIFETAIF